MKEKRLIWLRGIVFLTAFFVLIVAVRISDHRIRHNLELEIQKTLQDVAEQNVIAVEQEIESKQQLLEGISKNQDMAALSPQELVRHLNAFVGVYQFKRMGVIYPDGTVFTTDGYVQEVSYRDYFQRGMRGERTITDAMEEHIGEEAEQINVFSVPIFGTDGVTVEGVLFATYRTGRFQNLLNIESFEGSGYSFIVKNDGSLITNSEKSPVQDMRNLFDAMESEDADNHEQIEQMRMDMAAGGRGIVKYWYDEGKYLYYMPLNVVDNGNWYIITTVPEMVLSERLIPVMNTVDGLIAVVVVVVITSGLLYVYSGHKRKQELMRAAYVDPLTGGDNYACFQKKLESKKKTPGFMVSLDICGFKVINNTCGVDKGDEVIRLMWGILCREISHAELAAHVNGDGFILFLEDCERRMLEVRLDRIVRKISELSVQLQIPKLVPVMGIYHGDSMEEQEKCYGWANEAKHLIKNRRDRSYAYYDELDFRHMQEVRMVEDNFDEAIRGKRFEIWYQPKYSVKDSSVVGAEALVRWRKKNGELLSPGTFIPVLEKNGMIPRLDDYVFEGVCGQVKEWEAKGQRMLPVSVNISRVSLYYTDIVRHYCDIMESFRLKPDYIQLEITESAVVDNAEIAGLTEQFKAEGFKLLLDDFGNGYSSLSTLNTMHFDTLKIDKSLIDYIGDKNGEKLLHYIIRLAQSLGLTVTAEGVENKAQLEFLRGMKCDDVQGFYFSKPVPLAEYEDILASADKEQTDE